jgi:hypothetical protein
MSQIRVQVDSFTDARGRTTGTTIMLAEGLAIVVPDSRAFRRGRLMRQLTECCPRCTWRIRFWQALRFSHDHASPRNAYLECDCLILGFDLDRFQPGKLVASWDSFRRLQNKVLNQCRARELGPKEN